MKYDIFARCEAECKSDHCDDHGVDYCAGHHTEEEHFEPGNNFCSKMAWLSDGCEICQEMLSIYLDLQENETVQRECSKCRYLYNLDMNNPYGEVQWNEHDEEIYYECDSCCTLNG